MRRFYALTSLVLAFFVGLSLRAQTPATDSTLTVIVHRQAACGYDYVGATASPSVATSGSSSATTPPATCC